MEIWLEIGARIIQVKDSAMHWTNSSLASQSIARPSLP